MYARIPHQRPGGVTIRGHQDTPPTAGPEVMTTAAATPEVHPATSPPHGGNLDTTRAARIEEVERGESGEGAHLNFDEHVIRGDEELYEDLDLNVLPQVAELPQEERIVGRQREVPEPEPAQVEPPQEDPAPQESVGDMPTTGGRIPSSSTRSEDSRGSVAESCAQRVHLVTATKTQLLAPTRNDGRFRNDHAHMVYKGMSKRKVVRDPGFAAQDLEHPLLRDVIIRQGWQHFALHYTEPIPWEFIREFFANLHPIQSGNSWVRGKEVDYSAARINELFGIEGPFDYEIINERTSLAISRKLLNAFCGRSPDDETVPVKCPEKLLDPDLTPFLDFFNAKIRPTMQTRSTSGQRMLVLYRILCGERVNIGAWIEHSIYHCIAAQSAPMCHAGLLWRLCQQQGINLNPFQSAMTMASGNPIPIPPRINSNPLSRFIPFEGNLMTARQRRRERNHPPRSQSTQAMPSTSTTATSGRKRARVSATDPPRQRPRTTMPPPLATSARAATEQPAARSTGTDPLSDLPPPTQQVPSVARPGSPQRASTAPPPPPPAAQGPDQTAAESAVPETSRAMAPAPSRDTTSGTPIPHLLALPVQPTSSGSQSITVTDLTLALDRQKAQVMEMMREEREEQRKQREREYAEQRRVREAEREEDRRVREAEREEDRRVREAELKLLLDREDARERQRREEEERREKRRQEEREETMRLFALLGSRLPPATATPPVEPATVAPPPDVQAKPAGPSVPVRDDVESSAADTQKKQS